MRMRGWMVRAGVVAAALGLTLGTGAVANAAEREPTGPPQPNILAAGAYALPNPRIMPPGTNDWNCKPSPAHPNPVLLSNGTIANSYDDWAGLSQRLVDAGYCVFSTNIGGSPGAFIQTVGPVAGNASQLAEFGDTVLRATGAKKLDVVGHSQGGMSPRYWIKNLGGADKIGKLIGLSPSNHGTTFFGLLSLVQKFPLARDLVGLPLPSFNDQETNSQFLADLNKGGETVPGIDYTVLQTKYDDVVTPPRSAFLAPAPNVRNVWLQDVCAKDFTDHLGITYDPIAQQLVLNALDPAHARTPDCRFVPPVISSPGN
ncbi:esterase/lipase family protein [Sciscionella marina]|uniref:esterase/lipase family protein n=1 Tax=Sciscionella marina TaxID=508770 RepID=UPI000363F5EF|nr:alpha/beta fold hydrolase [Sciscionella marina]